MVSIVWVKDLLRVEGKSQKGKNRIREHGSVWEVIQVQDSGRCLLESTDGKENKRWVDAPTDVDFELVGIVRDGSLDKIMENNFMNTKD